jgi:hypothetical protein
MTTKRNRVPLHSDSENDRIKRTMRASVAHFADHRDQIADRLREIDEEWDIERAIEANAAVIGFTGTLLAATTDMRWLALPALVTAFLFQHAVQGWCPPCKPALNKAL